MSHRFRSHLDTEELKRQARNSEFPLPAFDVGNNQFRVRVSRSPLGILVLAGREGKREINRYPQAGVFHFACVAEDPQILASRA